MSEHEGDVVRDDDHQSDEIDEIVHDPLPVPPFSVTLGMKRCS